MHVTRKSKKTYKRRKEPSQERSRRTISRIVDATWDLLGEQGAKAVTTGNIATRSGVTVGSIYQYFPDKEAILFELYRRRLGEVVEKFRELTTPEMIELGPVKWDAHYTRTFDKLGWNQPAQLELNKACRFDQQLEKLIQSHFAKMQAETAGLLHHFYPKTDAETLRVLAKFLYGLGCLEIELLQSETARSARALIRSWRTEIIHMFFTMFKH